MIQVVHSSRGADMKEYISSVSPKGQITIPAEIREMFGVKPKDKVVFEVGDEGVKIRPLAARLEASYQAVPAHFLDTNFIIRFLTKDNPDQAERAYRIFQQLETGALTATTCEGVLVE